MNYMTTVVAILYVTALISLLIAMGMRPERSDLSRFELERRAKAGKPGAAQALRREELLHYVYSLQHAVTAILLVTVSALGVLLFHWALGFMMSLLIALEVGVVARFKPVAKLSSKVYERIEPKVLDLIESHPNIFKLLRTAAPLSGERYILQSREELVDIINQADSEAINDQEKQLIKHGLEFETRRVKEIMTPRDQIDTINKNEMLGPLVLDELHKTGHSRFPVIDKNIDHVIGVLHIRSLLQLDGKRSVTAQEAMEPTVYFVREDQTFAQALAAFLRTRHHLFIVIDRYQKTVGVLSLEDVIEALVGREIRDEHEADDNLQVVAGRSL